MPVSQCNSLFLAIICIKADLVGFREENVLQVSAFYKADVQINYLAELVRDNSVAVKESLVCLLGELMTEIGDRYDHQTRCAADCTDIILCCDTQSQTPIT